MNSLEIMDITLGNYNYDVHGWKTCFPVYKPCLITYTKCGTRISSPIKFGKRAKG